MPEAVDLDGSDGWEEDDDDGFYGNDEFLDNDDPLEMERFEMSWTKDIVFSLFLI